VIVGFLRFWWSFVVGDDWRVAAAVTAGIALVIGLHALGVHAWWLLPLIVAASLVSTIRTAARRRR
jgi:hypothetical protein